MRGLPCKKKHDFFSENIIFLKNYVFFIDFEILFQYVLSINLPHLQPDLTAMHQTTSRTRSAASGLSCRKRLPAALTGLPSTILPGNMPSDPALPPSCGTACCPASPVSASS